MSALPVDAATVILVRPRENAASSWEIFMVRRHVHSDFAADVYVFPGGKVDPTDREMDASLYTGNVDEWRPDNFSRELWIALHLAAIRELFEEAGILLARTSDMAPLSLHDADIQRYARYRKHLHAGTMSLAEIAASEGLRYDLSALHPFSRWITPTEMPRRFDTWFFVARMPKGQQPVHDPIETTEGVWISPADALRRYHNNEFPLVFATQRHLEQLAAFGSIEDVLASTTPEKLRQIQPRIVSRGTETLFLVPGDRGYDEA